jgi:hypothetical protein
MRSLVSEQPLRIAGWEVLGTLLLAASYLALPPRWRQVSTFKVLALNVAFAAVCVTALLILVTRLNGYTPARLGIGLYHLGPASTTVGLVTVLGVGALAGLARLGRRRLVLNANMIKLGLAYPAWAYVQQLLVMGVFINLVADWLGKWPGAVAGGLVFGAIHWGSRLFVFLTAAIGFLWAWSFLACPNLLPLAFSHAILATAHCYWIRGEDKWARIFAPVAARQSGDTNL